MFYSGDRFTRTGGAMPPTVLRLLQDKGSVQQLDGAAHLQHRPQVARHHGGRRMGRLIVCRRSPWISAPRRRCISR